jgi:hypothetical protein
MDYASSYAMGASQLDDAAAAPMPHAVAEALPPPRPDRMHWSTLLFGGGMVVCAIALLATIAGVPAAIGYDPDAAPDRNEPSSMDPLAITRSIDGNMKWIRENSSDAPDAYVGYIKSINRNEAAIPVMVQALVAMDAAVTSIDQGLAGMGEATSGMGDDIDAMVATSSASGATMQALAGDIGFLSRSMVDLAGATGDLTKRMAAIEAKAAGIANSGTSEALRTSKELNASLPSGVPVPLTDKGEPYDVAMQRLATAQGGGGGSDDVSDGASFQ